MKKTIVAALVALTAASAIVGPAAAASLTITTGDSSAVYHRYDDGDRYDNGWDRDRYIRHHYGWRHGMTYRRAYRECEVTTTRHWRHGRLIVERTRDCN